MLPKQEYITQSGKSGEHYYPAFPHHHNMSQAKRWVFTLNNYDEQEYSKIKTWEAVYHVIGKEVGESGTPHLQGFVIFAQPKRLTQLTALLRRAHWEVARGTPKQASDYCKKDGDFWEQGICPEAGVKRKFSDSLASWNESASRFIAEYPDEYRKHGQFLRQHFPPRAPSRYPVRAIWLYGNPGVGKSRAAAECGVPAYRKFGGRWFDGYLDEDLVIIDDLETDDIRYTDLLRWLDPYACLVEIKGGMLPLCATRFIITSNHTMADVFGRGVNLDALKRRCCEIRVDSLEQAQDQIKQALNL